MITGMGMAKCTGRMGVTTKAFGSKGLNVAKEK
jgi:hypothetical protein